MMNGKCFPNGKCVKTKEKTIPGLKCVCMYVCVNERKPVPKTSFGPPNYENFIFYKNIYMMFWSFNKAICIDQHISND